MCGVCGIARLGVGDGAAEGIAARVEAMVDALAHRGPDDAGTAAAARAVLGATRLLVRGLHSGRQPLRDDATGVLVVCNGEIDNHHELRRTLADRGRLVEGDSDVAVLPGMYLEFGEAFVERLVGAFAIAIYDPRDGRILLARDRVGERPLFYAVHDHEVRFATEIAPLAEDAARPVSIDQGALARYLARGCFVAPESPFREIRKVGPAEVVSIDSMGTRSRRYWRWGIVERAKQAADPSTFDAVFREAVLRQSATDVPCGVFLSGGIDSSLIAAVAAAAAPGRLRGAFTIRFREDTYDEGGVAEKVAQSLRLPIATVWMDPHEFPGALRELVRLAGEPLADPAWIPTAFLARRAAQDVKVALVGEGGDELFGGYPTYLGARAAERYRRLPRAVRALLRGALSAIPPSERKVTVSFLLRRFVEEAELDGMARHLAWTSAVTAPQRARLGVVAGEADPRGERGVDSGALLDRVQRWDLEATLAEGLLTKADRASMRSALELRAPFLDRDVLEFAAGLAPRERVSGFTTKAFLKRYALRYLPPEIVRRRKRGLSVPLGAWLRGPLASWASEQLDADLLALAGLDPDGARSLLSEHQARKADHGRSLWALLVLAEWVRWTAAHSSSPTGRS